MKTNTYKKFYIDCDLTVGKDFYIYLEKVEDWLDYKTKEKLGLNIYVHSLQEGIDFRVRIKTNEQLPLLSLTELLAMKDVKNKRVFVNFENLKGLAHYIVKDGNPSLNIVYEATDMKVAYVYENQGGKISE